MCATVRFCTLTAKDAAGPEAWLPAERPKNITNVVCWFDALRVFGVPVVDDTLDDLDSREVHVLKGQLKPILVHSPQVVEG